MNIIIVGGGVVGYSLAEHLLKDGHHLTLIEQDEELCASIADKLDIQTIVGSGSSPEILRQAGIAGANMVLAVTPNDEVNMVTCALARQHKVTQRIARLRSEDLVSEDSLVDLAELGVTSVIDPERVLADQIFQFVESPHAVEAVNFEEGRVLLRAYKVRDNMTLAGKTTQQIRKEIAPATILFAALVRDGVGMIPTGSTEIEAGDTVYALFPRDALDTFLGLVGVERKKRRKIIVTGDSFAAHAMARVLDETDHKVTLVDPNRKHATRMAEFHPKLEVIHGDCTEPDLLRELNASAASFFIALSHQTDYNMLSSLVARAEGANEIIATAAGLRHSRLFRSIGIDHVINPRLTAARAILDIISRGNIGAAVKFSGVDIEAVRYVVDPESDVAGMKVSQLGRKLKRGSILGVIVKGEKMIIPGGETVVETNDHVIVITQEKNLSALSKLFRARSIIA
jgi:trk system potassium uptake protein TrkA